MTEAQNNYFKDSKLLDSNNELQVFYHATKEKFDSFDKEFIGKKHGASFGEGFYFSTSPIPAYGENIAVYLDVKNPYILDLVNKENLFDFMKKLNIDKDVFLQKVKSNPRNLKACICATLMSTGNRDLQGLKDNGYDGLVIKNTFMATVGYIDKEVIVFEPNQIKSVDNLYPTKSDNFKDNSAEYFKQKGISPMDAAIQMAKDKKAMNVKTNTKEINKEKERE